ncbi:ABC transporter ATP-binding protein [Nocardia neocaledoniensis]|uniref:ABC transporter ATP-binding protein n=1 Tax=Nocardia neocaledoniensis TaxID=236511 RepID=UPI0024549B5D|nr:ATP-binding cassette domain-containing protein [Nocardia neocaledoniensis]
MVDVLTSGDGRGKASETTNATSVLRARDLDVAFGGVQALRGVSVDVGAGETVAVIGPNGAGKTTLLNAVCGLIGSDSSELSLRGESMHGMTAAARARKGIARSYQNPSLLEDATVLENVRCGGYTQLKYGLLRELLLPFGVRAEEAELTARCDGVLELMGLAECRDSVVKGLPHGTRKLIDIGRAIVAGPDLLLLDEPSSGLDSSEQHVVSRVLTELHTWHDMAILVVEHHMEVVRAVADRVLGMQAGAVLKSGTPHEVLDSPEFREALVGGRGLPNDGQERSIDG